MLGGDVAQDEPVFAALGPLTVLGPEGTSDLVPPGKRRSLLAALLRHRNTWVSSDELAAALWDRTAYPSSISGSLKTYVHQLRKLLPDDSGGERLAGGRGAYRLTVRPGELDIDLFECLVTEGAEALADGRPGDAVARQRRALALWRGLPDDDIVDVVAARHLEETRWTARYCLADALIEQGDPGEAIVVLRAALGDDPLREPVWERLMLAQRAAGWQVDALASYEQARTTLLEKFGAEPGRRLQEIYRMLLSDTAAAPRAPRTAPAVPTGEPDVVRPAPAIPARPRRTWSHAVFAGLLVVLLTSLSGSTVPRPGPGVPTATTTSRPRVLFGLGPNVIAAERSPLVSSGIGMMTTWYHGPNQLNQYEGWRQDVIPRIYRSGRAMHVVVATWEDGTSIETPRGRACGQPYPLSPEFLTDMRRLARAFAGRADGPPLYISMFHGLQKLACANTGYLADPATTLYYQALKDRYFEVLELFHDEAPNAKVALNWDGWTASYDEPDIGAGLSMFQYFVEAMSASDFQSFNAFEKKGNAEDIRQMVEVLGAYGPVMCAYFGPHEDRVEVYETDLETTFTPEVLSELVADGLFAFSFRDDDLLRASPPTMTMAAQVIRDYGHQPPRS
ncbi:DNA-binding SARP family transcriptional activator [Actinoplanes xinjiangensis]|uniref:DNA-binding SARP family transcriptional activator n=1 Tax=Actinoplanes xinjiangensis TaxID=512350 RepID=A0A316F5V5_9ACTN|nr:DNA-binding SARP family transcriptional activator [Actinoplanes xinjiangensis]